MKLMNCSFLCRIFVLIALFCLRYLCFSEKINAGFLPEISSLSFAVKTEGENYTPVRFESERELINDFLSGKIDVINIPLVTAEKLYSGFGQDICAAAVTSVCDVAIISSEYGVNSSSDLLGKKIFVSDRGIYSELLLSFFKMNGISTGGTSGGVEIEYVSDNAKILSGMRAGKIKLAVLGGIYLHSLLNDFKPARIIFNLGDEYSFSKNGKTLPALSVLIVKRSSYSADEQLYKDFFAEIAENYRAVKYFPYSAVKNIRLGNGVNSAGAVSAAKHGCSFLSGAKAKSSIDFSVYKTAASTLPIIEY